MKFKFQDIVVSTSEPYYDLFDGGYLKAEEILSDREQQEALNDAINLIQRFFKQAESSGVIYYE